MILDRVTLMHGKTHCGRGLLMDSVAHVVTDADAYESVVKINLLVRNLLISAYL